MERCLGGRDLTEPRLHPRDAAVVYAVSEAGSSMLVWHPLDVANGAVRAITTEPAPRVGRGLGGGCWCFVDDATAVVYVGVDGNLWSQPLDAGAPRRLTDHGPERAAGAPHGSDDDRWLAYVVDQAEVWLLDRGDGVVRRIDDGSADFCFDPFVSASGIVWQAWNVPDMPWDGARMQRWTFESDEIEDLQPVGALQQPRVLPDGTGICVRDDTGWLNVWVGDAPLVDEPFEHAGPSWGLGQRSHAWSPDGARVAFARNERGFGRLCVVERGTRVVTELGRGVHGQISWEGHRIAAIRSGARTPTQIVVYELGAHRSVVAVGPDARWADEELTEPELVDAVASDGVELHARLYRADGGVGGATDRLLVWLHGGPTDQWQVSFMPRLAYWRAQGWNVLVPDHRGSTGHGRRYQQALNGGWGALDVADTLVAVRHAHLRGWGSPRSTVVIGGSAGGFTALGSVAAEPTMFAAAVVSYPVTDLLDLAERSHRFERHSTHHLVGPLPATEALHRERSPVSYAHLLADTPLLVMHGDVDPVVPVAQSRVLVERCRAAGGTVELHVYEGEGHGFRQPVNQADEYRRIGDFLERHVPRQRIAD